MESNRRHPLNTEGDFYVLDRSCIECQAPEREAPDLMGHDCPERPGYQCFFQKQPATNDELERAIHAVAVGCCGSVRYGGTDPFVLRRLQELRAEDACDFPRRRWWQFWKG